MDDPVTDLINAMISLFLTLSSVGLDSEKRIFGEKMRKERKKRGKEAKS